MSYSVEFTPRFQKEFKKLDRYTQRIIKSWIDDNLIDCQNLRQHGRGLTRKSERTMAVSYRRLPIDLSNRR